MARRTRIQQIYARVESQEAVAADHATLAAAAYASHLPVEDGVLTIDPGYFDRGIRSGSFTPRPGTPGIKTGRFTFALEMTANGTLGNTHPQFSHLMRACGMTSAILTKVLWDGSLSAGTAKVIRHGATVTQGSQVFKVFGDVHLPDTPATEAATMWVGRQEALGVGSTALSAASDIVITGLTSATIATATIDSCTAAAAIGWFPRTDVISAINFDATGNLDAVAIGDVVRDTVTKAVGVIVSPLAATASGKTYLTKDSGYFGAGSLMERIAPTTDADIGTLAGSSQEEQVSVPTLTIGLNEDGIVSSLSGARGTFSIVYENGKPARVNFEFLGAYNACSDVVFVTGVTFAQRTPPTFIGSAFKLAPFNSDDTHADQSVTTEVSTCVTKVEVILGNQLEIRECSNASTGALGCVITGRKPQFKFDAEASSEAGFSMIGRMAAGSMLRSSWVLGGILSSPDQFFQYVPAAQISAIGRGDKKGILVRDVTCELTSGRQDQTSGDNEFVLIHPGA